MAITRDQIWATADELDAAAKPPTLAAVRKAVGGGSFTTIQDAMTEWKAKRQAKETPIKEPAPQALTDRLSEVGAEIWSMALQLANARLAADRETLEAERVQMEADRQEAADLADQLNEELDAAKARCADLERSERETAGRLTAALADDFAPRQGAIVLFARSLSVVACSKARRLHGFRAIGEFANR
jgi:hypothetical protein